MKNTLPLTARHLVVVPTSKVNACSMSCLLGTLTTALLWDNLPPKMMKAEMSASIILQHMGICFRQHWGIENRIV